MALAAKKKIVKEKGQEPDDFEEQVAQALFDLEATNSELKADLRDLYITGAKEIDVQGGSRKAVIVQKPRQSSTGTGCGEPISRIRTCDICSVPRGRHVPFRLLKAFHKVQQRLVRELEKKFSGKDVVIVANRRILPPSSSGVSNSRPRSRTLTAVHEAILGDLVYPTEIVGKRIRYRVDGSKLLKVFLDPKDRNTTEYKVDTFAGVYKKLTGKDVVFEFPVAEAAA
ncbi:40S ribosomal protein S7 [Monoraphidium neglectum]|uniref:40S ribosomal protein S7 n=1 Tax=Monoraphidium neglectum TaxID=145388 RepID=A0A0D2MFA1_9CHLO|nr:40S ribosomal protein S7 [Monoraphidium neglectum]KIZ01820.1 40S ribosomal protein S7 [Monoraphidium neglectum]|eukprot:XP_013900839.1 40S ribosomal protein S7 [Monoraphidium neglectum]